MTAIRLTAASRLHFGLLARGPSSPRQFGGLGLMVRDPGLVLEARRSTRWTFTGPSADRASRVIARLKAAGYETSPLEVQILRAPPEHSGLGSGTQLSLAVAKLAARFGGQDPSAPELAARTGRGRRSGVGLHGFDEGGLILDGGHRGEGEIPPRLARLGFPPQWSVLVAIPAARSGLSGPEELGAFASLPPIPDRETDRLCRLVLLGLLPAVAERDLPAFGAALEEIQERVGRGFAPAQGGTFASPLGERIAATLRGEGLVGVGQSSWGPTIYGFGERPSDERDAILGRLRAEFPCPMLAFWTSAAGTGAVLTELPGGPPTHVGAGGP